MSDQSEPESRGAKPPPISVSLTPIDVLIRAGNVSAPRAPGQLATLDRFEILRLIGAGGMGLVFLARDSGNDSKVAIKMLRPELAVEPQAGHRFLKEVRHLRRLQHPHILGILEMSERQEGPYFVMPYLERGSVARIIQPEQPLASDLTLRIACQIAEALAFAHSKGIIHRDLKPGNVLLDVEGNAFLTDFGLARTLFNDSMMDVDRGHCEGTAPYMSPAVAAGQAEDTRCDIYSFGALLYEMLTGRPPYEGQTTAEVLQRVREKPPKPISEVNPKASPALVAIAQGAMERSHRDRYASMADVLADLERVAQGQSPLGPHGQWKAPRRWPSLMRQRPLVVIAAVVLVALVSIVAWWLRPNLRVIHQFQLPADADGAGTMLGDWDGDKDLDLFVPTKDRCLVLSTDGTVVTDWSPGGTNAMSFGINMVTDFNRDGLDDVFLHWTAGGKANLAAFNRLKYPLMRVAIDDKAPVHPQHGPVPTSLSALQMADLNRDGQPELLAMAITSWGLQPRGLYCFDAANQTLLWNHHVAAYPSRTLLADLDGDGNDEVVLGSTATANGSRLADGTDDAHCYLHVMSHRGQLLWRKELGDIYTRAEPLLMQFTNGQRPRLYAAVCGELRSRERVGKLEVGTIIEFDAKGNPGAKYDGGAQLLSYRADDLNGDGQPEILATDRRGFLHVLDPNLNLLKKAAITANDYSSVDLKLIAVTNVADWSSKQLVFSSSQIEVVRGTNPGNNRIEVNVRFHHNNSVHVWDASLKPLASYTLEKKTKEAPNRAFRVADWDGDGLQEIVVLDRQVRVLKFAPRGI